MICVRVIRKLLKLVGQAKSLWGGGCVQRPELQEVSSHAGICWEGTEGLPRWASGKESNCQCRRLSFDRWVKKIPWNRKQQTTPVLLLREFHGQRSLAGCRPWGSQRVRHDQARTDACCTLPGRVHRPQERMSLLSSWNRKAPVISWTHPFLFKPRTWGWFALYGQNQMHFTDLLSSQKSCIQVNLNTYQVTICDFLF